MPGMLHNPCAWIYSQMWIASLRSECHYTMLTATGCIEWDKQFSGPCWKVFCTFNLRNAEAVLQLALPTPVENAIINQVRSTAFPVLKLIH